MALKPVGTGPFMYDKGTPGTRTEAVRFDGYWGEKALVDRITNTIIGDANTGYTALENGELEALGVYEIDKANELRDKGFNVVDIPYLEILYIGCNAQIKPFDDIRVREAFFAAIDPQYFIDNIFYGTTQIPGSYVPAASKYALKDYFKPNYDPARTKQLLAETGVDKMTVTLWAPNDSISTTPSVIAESQLTEAGFKVEMQSVDFGVFVDKVRSGEAQLWLLYNTTPVVADETVVRYTSGNYPGRNWSGILDKEYDSLVEQGVKATTEADKADYFERAQKRLIDLKIIYPISTHNFSYVTKPNVSGYEISLEGLAHLNRVKVN
jgi:ABC-type transport system substrate-binding protein